MNPVVPSKDGPGLLAGVTVLVVEDDYFSATDCANALRARGADVLGPVPDVVRARALVVERNPDCVMLDVHLKGSLAVEFAAELVRQGIPTVIATGYDLAVLPPALRRLPCLQKPFETHTLVKVVSQAVTARRGGTHGA